MADSYGPNVWEAPVYKGAKTPTECTTCNKRGMHMRMLAAGEIECSHVDCPHRKRFTAAPGRKPNLEE